MAHRTLARRLHLLSSLVVVCATAARAGAGVGPSYGGPQITGNLVLPSPSTAKGRFGSTIGAGDFDGDGHLDLVIGAPNDDSSGVDAGRVDVFLWKDGFMAPSGQFFGASGSLAGSALAVGNFDEDPLDEIAIGLPDATSGVVSAGAVVVVKWSDLLGNVIAVTDLFQGMALLGETQEAWDEFGSALVAGDFNGDGFDDLAVGVPHEDLGASAVDQGMVHVFYGFPTGLSALGSQTFTQGTGFVPGAQVEDDNFGSSLAAGDFDHNGRDDLAIGAKFDTITGLAGAGSVTVLYGVNESGLTGLNSQIWAVASGGLPGTPEPSSQVGTAVATGDFDCDGYDDLAIGAPFVDVDGLVDAGRVYVLRGSSTRLSSSGITSFGAGALRQGSPGTNDRFGWRLLSAHFDGGRCPGLAITSPWGGPPGTLTGAVDVVLGIGGVGLAVGTGAHFDASMLTAGPAQNGDSFGGGLGAGDLDGDGDEDLFVGLPGRRAMPGGPDIGLVQLLLVEAKVFGHDFDLGLLDGWSDSIP